MATRRTPRIAGRAVHPASRDLGYVGSVLVDRDRIYACGGTQHRNTLLASDDRGATFRRLTGPVTTGLRAIHALDGRLYLVGEYGLLAVSVDAGVTWTAIPTPTTSCLFDLHRAADGTWWIAGDDGVILRSRDGVAFERVDAGWDTRLLAIVELGGAVHLLGYDGAIRRWTGEAWEPLAFVAGAALTSLIETRAGTWIAIGDARHLYRSADRGASFARVPLDCAGALEAILELPCGLLVCGEGGELLFSDDDGRTWVRVETEATGHLWSLTALGPTAVLLGGEAGALWRLDISDRETVAAEIVPEPEPDEPDEPDEPAFASVEAASARWIREGEAFSAALNAYVRRIYEVGHAEAGPEPEDTRSDMAPYVVAQLAALNAAGAPGRARALFPPAYEPFDYDELATDIDHVAYLRDGRRLARRAGEVFVLERDRIAPIPGVAWFAQSIDRRWVAKAAPGASSLAISDGWDGPVARVLAGAPAGVRAAVVAPAGDAVLVAAETGVYWLGEAGAHRLHPDGPEAEVSYAHAALSPNGRFVALGVQDGPHLVIDRKTGRRDTFDPVASYPHFAAFHRDRPDLLLSSCHALHGSGSLAVDLEKLVARAQAQRVIDRGAWVYAAVSLPSGYLVGDRSGYLWALDFAGERQWFTFLGSTITSLDLSPDGATALAGSSAGIVVELDLHAPDGDPRLLSTGPVRDLARWVFWADHAPLVW